MYELQFLRSLALTIFTETLLLLLLFRVVYQTPATRLGSSVILMGGILSSGATLPYVWFLFPVWVKNFYLYAAVAEIFAILAEAVIYQAFFRVSWSKAFVLSGFCNMGSFGTGRGISWLMRS